MRARAERLVDSGKADRNSDLIRDFVASRRERGATSNEVKAWWAETHGDTEHQIVTSVLTTLHKNGQLLRLMEVREGCKVYVFPGFEQDRVTEPYVSNQEKLIERYEGEIAALKEKLAETHATMSMVWNYLDKFFPGWKEKVRAWNNAGCP